ncbi:uncharacterized protein ZBIST_5137 [Zygosaccharomyces bailii]|nr:uncharacterized protein ZBIST_5137 [Zygosaccharomyces bailii]
MLDDTEKNSDDGYREYCSSNEDNNANANSGIDVSTAARTHASTNANTTASTNRRRNKNANAGGNTGNNHTAYDVNKEPYKRKASQMVLLGEIKLKVYFPICQHMSVFELSWILILNIFSSRVAIRPCLD